MAIPAKNIQVGVTGLALEKIKKNSDFKKVYQYGKSVANRYLVLYFLKNDLNEKRIGFSISKKVGNAVRRNKVRRLLHEVCRINSNYIEEGWDIVIIVRPKFAEEVNYYIAEAYLKKLLKKSGLYKEEVME